LAAEAAAKAAGGMVAPLAVRVLGHGVVLGLGAAVVVLLGRERHVVVEGPAPVVGTALPGAAVAV
jgi:hypothetical protein